MCREDADGPLSSLSRKESVRFGPSPNCAPPGKVYWGYVRGTSCFHESVFASKVVECGLEEKVGAEKDGVGTARAMEVPEPAPCSCGVQPAS